jgi:hypothetical protein
MIQKGICISAYIPHQKTVGIIMSGCIIPGWNPQGVLPPADPSDPTSRLIDRSPYEVCLNDFVLRFGISSERLNLLDNLFSFRSSLHEAGLVRGFQWLDGSFCESIETLESRAPRDIDVVTFYYLPAGESQQSFSVKYPELLRRKYNYIKYHMDAYFVDIDGGVLENLISDSVYWYSVWSHRRNALWKGYLQIDLSPTDDHIARDSLKRIIEQGGTP